MNIESRITKLQAMDWRKAKAIADSLGLTKPQDQSWDDFAEAIALAEQEQSEDATLIEAEESEPTFEPLPEIDSPLVTAEQVSEAIASGSITLEPIEPEVTFDDSDEESEVVQEILDVDVEPEGSEAFQPKGTYATEYFKANNIPYCATCGAQNQSAPDGSPVCPESLPSCPRLTSAE